MRYLHLLFFVILMTACANQAEKQVEGPPEKKMPQWVEAVGDCPPKVTDYPTTANYIPVALGDLNQERIMLNYSFSHYQRHKIRKDSFWHVNYKEDAVKESFGSIISTESEHLFLKGDSAEIIIKVVPSRVITNLYIPERSDTAIAYDAWPVIVTNPHNDSIIIGRGKNINLVLEAQTASGNWQAMETKYEYGYGVMKNLPLLVLPPQKSVITSLALPRDTSEYKVFRLFMGENTSDNFNIK